MTTTIAEIEGDVLSAPCGYKAMQQGMIDNHEATCPKCKEIANTLTVVGSFSTHSMDPQITIDHTEKTGFTNNNKGGEP